MAFIFHAMARHPNYITGRHIFWSSFSYDAMDTFTIGTERCDWHKQWLVFKKTKQIIFIGWSIHDVVRERHTQKWDILY
jgi:hypothetical protein